MSATPLTRQEIDMILNAIRIASEDGSINFDDDRKTWDAIDRLTDKLKRMRASWRTEWGDE